LQGAAGVDHDRSGAPGGPCGPNPCPWRGHARRIVPFWRQLAACDQDPRGAPACDQGLRSGSAGRTGLRSGPAIRIRGAHRPAIRACDQGLRSGPAIRIRGAHRPRPCPVNVIFESAELLRACDLDPRARKSAPVPIHTHKIQRPDRLP